MTVAVLKAINTGFMEHYASSTTYATIHDAASAIHTVNNSTTILAGQLYNAVDYFYVVRSGLVYNIASIPLGASASSASVDLMGAGDDSDTDFNITLVSGTDLADTIVAADYGDLLDEITSYGSLTTVGFQLDPSWNTINLNATGLAALQTAITGGSGRFRLGLRSSRDIDSITPKLNGADASEYVTCWGAYTADKEPKLTITYTGGFTPKIFII